MKGRRETLKGKEPHFLVSANSTVRQRHKPRTHTHPGFFQYHTQTDNVRHTNYQPKKINKFLSLIFQKLFFENEMNRNWKTPWESPKSQQYALVLEEALSTNSEVYMYAPVKAYYVHCRVCRAGASNILLTLVYALLGLHNDVFFFVYAVFSRPSLFRRPL